MTKVKFELVSLQKCIFKNISGNTCNVVLCSSHLPAYLIAAFAKKFARISLWAPPASLLVVIPFIYNLIDRHPVCRQLVHRPPKIDKVIDSMEEPEIDTVTETEIGNS